MNERYTWLLAGGYTVGFFALTIVFHFYPSPNDSQVLGRVFDGEMIVLGWAYGSSVSSRLKDQALIDNKDHEEKKS